MSFTVLILIPLIAGYAFSINWVGSRYSTFREDGYRLYFRSGFYAFFLFIHTSLVVFILRSFHPNSVNGINEFLIEIFNISKKDEQFQIVVFYMDIALIILPFSILLGVLLNFIPGSKAYFYKKAVKNDDFERLVRRSVVKEMPMAITMRNKKVYVGYAVRGLDPSDSKTGIRILPVLSGFRNSTDGKVVYTTKYTEVYLDLYLAHENESDDTFDHLFPGDFEIVLPVAEIQSSHLFDINAFELFENKNRNTSKMNSKPFRVKGRS